MIVLGGITREQVEKDGFFLPVCLVVASATAGHGMRRARCYGGHWPTYLWIVDAISAVSFAVVDEEGPRLEAVSESSARFGAAPWKESDEGWRVRAFG